MPIAELPSAKAVVYLELLSGEQAGTRYPLNGDKSILGRHPDCQIVIDVGAVSRQHATITHDAKGYWIEDLKSRNGTFVNDVQISGRVALKPDDRIKICDYEFGFQRTAPDIKQTFTAGRTLSDFGFGVLMDEDETADGTPSDEVQNGVLSKLDLRSGFDGTLRLTSNPEVKLRALLEITQSLGRTFSNETVLPKLLDSLFKIFMQADRGVVALKTKEGKIVPMAVKTRRGGEDESIRLSRTLVNEVLNSKQAILSKNTADDARFDMSQSITDFHIRSLVCAPLINSEGEVLGLIQLDSLDTRSQFQSEDLEVLAAVATQAAFVMENIALHENLITQNKLERDLQLAHKVQQGLLPKAPPLIDHYHFFDFYEPANQVGGDFYDYIPLPGGKLGICLADVSGKGVAAALVMAKLSADVRYCLASEPELDLAVNQINAAFCRNAWEDRFVTFVMLVLDPRRHEINIVNAGHMPPFLRRPDGTVITLAPDESGLPLGVSDDYSYTMVSHKLESGDFVALYTDGFSEANNAKNELYSIERLQERIGMKTEGVTEIGRAILSDVQQFVGGTPQFDDMCLVCFGRESSKTCNSVG
jgi:sigma-B regulation protein RsbU (phosphoserine phosphatase)